MHLFLRQKAAKCPNLGLRHEAREGLDSSSMPRGKGLRNEMGFGVSQPWGHSFPLSWSLESHCFKQVDKL
jgi:hypothetical protein